MEKINLFDYVVYDRPLGEVQLNKKIVINTINGHSYSVAKKDDAFKLALQSSDILLPDGDSIVFGVRVICGKKIKKIAGYDIFTHLLYHLENEKGKCFFLGAMDETLTRIKARINREFPNIEVGSFSPPYKDSFSDNDNRIMQKRINDFIPDVLFVGMTAPKQEKWVHNNVAKLNATVICSIGAVFDFYAGTAKRPPQWLINLKLEWFGRLIKEPKRMWRRYLFSTPVFFIDIFRYKFFNRK